MSKMREEIARELYEHLGIESSDPWDDATARRAKLDMEDGLSANQRLCLSAADRILAIPQIKEALAYMEAVDSAHPVFGEIREMLDKQKGEPPNV